MSDKNLSRRSFLQAAGITSAAVASGGLLASTSGAVSAQDVTWDRTVDVIVIGSGTGQLAAIKAATDGLETVCPQQCPLAQDRSLQGNCGEL